MKLKEIFIGVNAPGKVALVICCSNQDKKTFVSLVEFMLKRHKGEVLSEKRISEIFSRVTSICISKNQIDEEELRGVLLEANVHCQEIITHPQYYEIICREQESTGIVKVLQSRGLIIDSIEVKFRPIYLRLIQNISANEIADFLSLMKELEGLSMVKKVWTNLNVSIEDII